MKREERLLEQKVKKGLSIFVKTFSKRPLFWFIIVITMLMIVIDWPTMPVKFTIGNWHVDETLRGPDLDELSFNKISRTLDLKLGLDLQGGTLVALRGDMTNVSESEREDKLSATREIIKNRVDLFGLSESTVYTSVLGDDYRIIVELPGAGEDVDQKIDILRQTAKLDFWSAKTSEEISLLTDNDFAAAKTPEQQLALYYKKSNVTGADLKTASATKNSQTGEGYEILLEFTDQGSEKFSVLAQANLGKQIAIVLDNIPLSQPTVNSDFGQQGTNKFVTITGNFTQESAENLAIQLRGGALPIPVEIVQQKRIEPTLGAEALRKSVLAGVIGILLLMIFMVYLYRGNGIIAGSALIVYVLINLAIYKLVPVTLSLAGIAGFIMSVGVAVDGNILIFERMLEEIREGRNKIIAAKIGFQKAWPSIRDSNGSTLITCFILFYFGTSAVKAFSISLAIGVLVGLFTAITVTRTFMRVFTKN